MAFSGKSFFDMFLLQTPLWDISLRVFLAILLGGILGLEREKSLKPAGLRTHMLVSLGSATYVLLNLEIMEIYRTEMNMTHIDPGRVIQGIITGIGFLGAGSIISVGKSVHGLTTAASIWLIGAIGATCGFGLYGLAIFTTLIGLSVLTIVRIIKKVSREKKINKS